MKNYQTGNLVDDAARILASPLPRRQALKALSGVLTGGLLAALGVRQAAAQTCSPACKGGETCCVGVNGQRFCSIPGGTCCGNTSCNDTQQCCRTSAQPFCTTNPTCCGTTSCGPNISCCANVCCGAGQACKNGRCQGSIT